MTDINAEFKRYQECCIAASKALESQKFPEAGELFRQAMEIARLYSPQSLDEAYCLQGLGDAHLGQYQFAEAKSCFQQVDRLLGLHGETTSERNITILLKLAKCHEKMAEFDQACNIYARATTIAEALFPLGHPKLTNVLECYANVLRYARKEPKTLTEIEQKVFQSRSKQNAPQTSQQSRTASTTQLAKISDNPMKAEATRPVSEQPVRTRSMVQEDYSAPEETSPNFIELAKANPRIVVGAVGCLLILLIFVMNIFQTIDEMKGKRPFAESSPAAVGKTYVSADGSEVIRFIGNGKVEIKGAAGFTCARCYEANPLFSELIAAFILQSPKQRWLVPNSIGLRDPLSGKQLYDLKKCPIKDLPKQMELVGRACLDNLVRYHHYYDATSILANVPEIKEKLSDGKEYLPLVKDGDKETMTKEIHHFVDHRSDELVHQTFAPNKIVCLTMPGGEKMIICATDDKGAPIKSQVGTQLLVVITDGQIIPSDGIATKTPFFNHLPKSLVISSLPPDDIRQLYLKGLFLWPIALVVAFAGYMLKTYSAAGDRDSQLPMKVRALAWLGFTIAAIITSYFLYENTMAYLFR